MVTRPIFVSKGPVRCVGGVPRIALLWRFGDNSTTRPVSVYPAPALSLSAAWRPSTCGAAPRSLTSAPSRSTQSHVIPMTSERRRPHSVSRQAAATHGYRRSHGSGATHSSLLGLHTLVQLASERARTRCDSGCVCRVRAAYRMHASIAARIVRINATTACNRDRSSILF
jgi:hypothetical protein